VDEVVCFPSIYIPARAGTLFLTQILVCWRYWVNYHGFSAYAYQIVSKSIRNGLPPERVEHGNLYRQYSAAGFELVKAWIETLEKAMGDVDPTSRGSVFLPPRVSLNQCYVAFKHDCIELGMDKTSVPGERYFRKIWKAQFPHFKAVRHNRLGVCDLCVSFDLRIQNATGDERKELIQQKKEHIAQVMKGMN
jgi:hypothetical protein